MYFTASLILRSTQKGDQINWFYSFSSKPKSFFHSFRKTFLIWVFLFWSLLGIFSLFVCLTYLFPQHIFQVLMLAVFSNLSARENHQVQKNTLLITKMAQIYLCDGGSVPAPPGSISLGGSETSQLNCSIWAHCRHSYLFVTPGSEQVPHGTDELQSITEELKIPFQPQQEEQEPDEGRTQDHLQWGSSCPGKSWGHGCDTQHRNPSSGMFCRWCVGRREEMRALWARVLGLEVT